MKDKVVLVTGSSSGIGAALCREFHRRGCRVVATARRIESIAPLAGEGMLIEALDVTDGDAIDRCIRAAVARAGHIDVLVNNAGYGLMGPVINLSSAEVRAQFECNLIAPLALARAVAPVMRDQGGGLIANVGSISGVVTTPFSGAYCASKAALHAASDALRMELRAFGIRVVTVQPGSIQSGFGAAAARTVAHASPSASWYAKIEDRILERAQMSQVGATPAAVFATKTVSALLDDDPPDRLRLGSKSFVGPLVKALLPRKFLDRILMKRFGLDSLSARD